MLDGHTGEIILGIVFVIITIVAVWALVRSAGDGIAARKAGRQRQQP